MVGVETAKLKSVNIIFARMHNYDAMHAVALLALPGTPLRDLYI